MVTSISLKEVGEMIHRALLSKEVRAWILVACLTPALAGCGVQFLYNNLDSLVSAELRQYMDMTPEQAAYFERQLGELWNWHRSEALPDYADAIDDWARLVDSGISTSQVDQAYVTMQDWWQAIVSRGTPAAKSFLKQFEDTQVTALGEAFERENKKWDRRSRKDSLIDRQKKWRKNFERLLERFIGALSADQRQVLVLGSADYRPARALWGEYRLRWQAEIMHLLAVRGEPEGFNAQFERVFGSQEALYGEELTAIGEHNEALARRLLLTVLESIDDKQKARFKQRMGEWANDFRELAAQSDDQ